MSNILGTANDRKSLDKEALSKSSFSRAMVLFISFLEAERGEAIRRGFEMASSDPEIIDEIVLFIFPRQT